MRDRVELHPWIEAGKYPPVPECPVCGAKDAPRKVYNQKTCGKNACKDALRRKTQDHFRARVAARMQ